MLLSFLMQDFNAENVLVLEIEYFSHGDTAVNSSDRCDVYVWKSIKVFEKMHLLDVLYLHI